MNVRKYGNPPFKTAVLHGGPGAPGYMAPVARELAKEQSILEPLQSADSLDGQVEEIFEQLSTHAQSPVTLIGSSWGAVLALLMAARKPKTVKKLILIGSAVFDAKSSARIEGIRLQRLSEEKRQQYRNLKAELKTAPPDQKNRVLDEWASIIFEADTYDPLSRDLEVIKVQHNVHEKVWNDFVDLRDRPGYLASGFSKITVPTIVIHGEHDPHPIDGIRPFLQSCLPDVSFHILPKCGHYPWIERWARDEFYGTIGKAIKGETSG